MESEDFTSTEKLKNLLLKRFKGRRLTYELVRYQTLMDTLFRKTDYANTLKQLEHDGQIRIEGRGSKGAIHDETTIVFLK
jgi:hypothetical protein